MGKAGTAHLAPPAEGPVVLGLPEGCADGRQAGCRGGVPPESSSVSAQKASPGRLRVGVWAGAPALRPELQGPSQ